MWSSSFWGNSFWSGSNWPGGSRPVLGLRYRYLVYANTGAGDPINYVTPVATLSTLSWTSGALAPGSDWSFGVRVEDTVSGLIERNTDVQQRVALDSAGLDLTARPAPPSHIAVAPRSNGPLVYWLHLARKPIVPTGFHVWATVGGSVNYAALPNATVPYTFSDGRLGDLHYGVVLTGLAASTTYAIGVRAYNAAGDEQNTLSVSYTTPGAVMPPVDNAAIAGTFIRG